MENRTEILRKIKPSKIEGTILKIKINRFLGRLNKNLEGAEAILGGSVAKDTHLRGTSDVDIFVLYENNKDISNRLEKSLKIFKDVERLKGSRDYFQVMVYGLNFEIVPVLKIKNAKEAENITDVSPLHAEWVEKNTKKNLADEIRIAKTFCRAQGVYGAESYIRGFSGYVLEILTIYYGGFEKFLSFASRWKGQVILDPEKQLQSPLKELNPAKITSPLIVVDPADKTRNASAVLSEQVFSLFIEVCKQYIKKPSLIYFTHQEKKIPSSAVILSVVPLEGKEDIVGAKILKVYEFLLMKLQEEGFEIK